MSSGMKETKELITLSFTLTCFFIIWSSISLHSSQSSVFLLRISFSFWKYSNLLINLDSSLWIQLTYFSNWKAFAYSLYQRSSSLDLFLWWESMLSSLIYLILQNISVILFCVFLERLVLDVLCWELQELGFFVLAKLQKLLDYFDLHSYSYASLHFCSSSLMIYKYLLISQSLSSLFLRSWLSSNSSLTLVFYVSSIIWYALLSSSSLLFRECSSSLFFLIYSAIISTCFFFNSSHSLLLSVFADLSFSSSSCSFSSLGLSQESQFLSLFTSPSQMFLSCSSQLILYCCQLISFFDFYSTFAMVFYAWYLNSFNCQNQMCSLLFFRYSPCNIYSSFTISFYNFSFYCNFWLFLSSYSFSRALLFSISYFKPFSSRYFSSILASCLLLDESASSRSLICLVCRFVCSQSSKYSFSFCYRFQQLLHFFWDSTLVSFFYTTICFSRLIIFSFVCFSSFLNSAFSFSVSSSLSLRCLYFLMLSSQAKTASTPSCSNSFSILDQYFLFLQCSSNLSFQSASSSSLLLSVPFACFVCSLQSDFSVRSTKLRLTYLNPLLVLFCLKIYSLRLTILLDWKVGDTIVDPQLLCSPVLNSLLLISDSL